MASTDQVDAFFYDYIFFNFYVKMLNLERCFLLAPYLINC